jgi:cytochrome c-type biogenesis protein CcmH
MMGGGFRIRKSGFRGWLVASLLILVMVLLPGDTEAQERQVTRSEDVAERAIGKVRSPYCPGLMLEVCPSPEAGALRDSIRVLATEGMSEAELIEWMIANHGEEWRAVPKRSGRGIFAWVMPPLFLLVGVGVVVARLRREQARSQAVAGDAPRAASDDLSSEERARLEAALSEWELEEEAEV